MTNLTAEQLRRAASIKDQIESLQTELDQLLGSVESTTPGRGRRGMSASARGKIAAAQRARWAKLKSRGEKPARKGRRKMSAAGRARIAAAARARWAKAKKAGRNTL